jgi:hypothetical protein
LDRLASVGVGKGDRNRAAALGIRCTGLTGNCRRSAKAPRNAAAPGIARNAYRQAKIGTAFVHVVIDGRPRSPSPRSTTKPS